MLIKVVADRHEWRGVIRVIRRSLEGDLLDIYEAENLVMDVGRNLVRDLLRGAATDGRIKYMALGTGATAPAAGQTGLVSEQFRKQVTQYTSANNQLTTTTYVAPGEGNFAIAELGWFAGASAAAGAGTGIMVARFLYSHTKTNLESIQVDRIDLWS